MKLFSKTWGTSSSFFTDLGACTVVPLTYPHSSLLLALLLCRKFFPFLTVLCQGNYHRIDGVTLVSLPWRWLSLTLWTWWKLPEASHRATIVATLLSEPGHTKSPHRPFSFFCAVFFSLIWMSHIHKSYFNLHSLKLESKKLVHMDTVQVCEKGWQWADFYLTWTKTRVIYFFSWKESELLQKTLRRKEVTRNEEKFFWLLVTMKIFMVQKHLRICMRVLRKPSVNGTWTFIIIFVYLNIFNEVSLIMSYYFHVSALNYQHEDQLQHYIFLF